MVVCSEGGMRWLTLARCEPVNVSAAWGYAALLEPGGSSTAGAVPGLADGDSVVGKRARLALECSSRRQQELHRFARRMA